MKNRKHIWYKLDENKNVIPCENEIDLKSWLETVNLDERTGIGRKVDLFQNDETTVSTVFLSLDHGWNSDKPIVFETMVFGGELDEYCERYATWDEAQTGHDRIVQKVKNYNDKM